jgi:hypothetical protein
LSVARRARIDLRGAGASTTVCATSCTFRGSSVGAEIVSSVS